MDTLQELKEQNGNGQNRIKQAWKLEDFCDYCPLLSLISD